VSIGAGAYRAALGLMRRIATQLRDEGTFDLIGEFMIPFAETNKLLAQ
jgi:hypothetical protein